MYLVDSGLIHKYLVNREDINKIEEETFLTVTVIKDLSSYEIENKDNKLIVSNEFERLVFKKVKVGDLEYMLDEFNFAE